MKQAGMETELRNTVFHWVRSHSNHDSISGYSVKEPLAYLRKAQVGGCIYNLLFLSLKRPRPTLGCRANDDVFVFDLEKQE